VRGITATGLSSAQTVNTPDDNAEDRRGRDQHQDQERESPRHTPAVAVDPTTCELIQQQQDSATVPDLPDQALMRLRAYNRPASTISASGKGSADFEA